MKLDHIVHFTHADPAASERFWRKAGFHAVAGGSHTDWGTHNALMYGKDYYIEWLAVENKEIAGESKHPLVEHLRYDQQGFGTICLRSGNLKELAERLEAKGFEVSGPVDAKRRTGTGGVIRWKMLFINQDISDALPLPFFIEWEEPEDIRMAGLKDKGAIRESNERLELHELVFSVANPEQREAEWKKLLGGSLELENCRLLFNEGAGKERLSEVRFAPAEKALIFEGGLYRVPRFE